MDKDLNVNGAVRNESSPGADAEHLEPTLPQVDTGVTQGAAFAHGEHQPEDSAAPQSWFTRMVSNPRAPYVVGGAVLAVLALFGARQYLPQVGIGSPNIVVFDPVKFANAQRAAASILAVAPSADLTLTMTQVAKNADPVIREEAHGALVLVKQAVVTPEGLPDITDAVLKHFGLPTTVPTVSTDPSKVALESLAPTDMAYSSGKQAEDYRMELQKRDSDAAAAAAKADTQQKVLP